MGIASFLLSKEKKIIGKKWESQERETLQKLLASVVACGWGRRNPEEQVSPVEGGSPACLVSPCPLHPTLVPPHRSALHIHTHFPWAQVGEPESDPRAELAERFMSSRELAGEGDTGAESSTHYFTLPGIALSHGACGRVTGVVMAFIQRWDGFLLKVESYPTLPNCVMGVRGQAGPSWQATPWQSEPSVAGQAWKQWETKTSWYGVTP